MGIERAKCVMIIAAMPDCPACHDFLPRFERQLRGWQAHGVPFIEVASVDAVVLKGQIPILVLDATSADPGIQGLCDRFGITGMPTSLMLPKVGQPIKLEGAIDDRQIFELLNAAVIANR